MQKKKSNKRNEIKNKEVKYLKIIKAEFKLSLFVDRKIVYIKKSKIFYR